MNREWGDDPAYDHEFDVLEEVCREFLAVRGDRFAELLVSGKITAQCATIYKLAPPGGLIDIPSMFVRDENL